MSRLALGMLFVLLFENGSNAQPSAWNHPSAVSDFRWSLHRGFPSYRGNLQEVPEETPGPRKKSVAKAVIFSAILPGTGQFYTNSYVKGAVFLATEVVAVTGHFYYQSQGEKKESEFQRYADQYWVEDDYWDWLSQISGISRADMDALREFERQNFSHSLPEEKNQQYYENIGKYDQFNIGWIDTQNGGARDSDLRERYTLMRKDANDQFKIATTFATVVLFNHLISALEAGLSTKKFNRKHGGVKARLRMGGVRYRQTVIPSINLGVRW